MLRDTRRFSPGARKLAGVATFALMALGGLALPTQAQDKTTIQYQQAFAPSAADLPLYTAQAKGFFEEEGIEVTIRSSQDAANAVTLVGIGDADIGISYPPDILLAHAKGIPVMGIWAKYQINPMGIVSLEDEANIATPADLKGKRIGLTPLPIDQTLFDAVLDNAGLTRDDVEIFNPGFNGGQMVGEKKLDGASAVPWYEVDQLKANGMKPVLMEYREHGGIDFPFMTLITNRDFAETNPEVLKAFLRALRKGFEYSKEHPQEALDFLIEAEPALNRASQELTMKTVAPMRETEATAEHGLGYLDIGELQQLADFLYARDLLEDEVDASDVFTNEYR